MIFNVLLREADPPLLQNQGVRWNEDVFGPSTFATMAGCFTILFGIITITAVFIHCLFSNRRIVVSVVALPIFKSHDESRGDQIACQLRPEHPSFCESWAILTHFSSSRVATSRREIIAHLLLLSWEFYRTCFQFHWSCSRISTLTNSLFKLCLEYGWVLIYLSSFFSILSQVFLFHGNSEAFSTILLHFRQKYEFRKIRK